MQGAAGRSSQKQPMADTTSPDYLIGAQQDRLGDRDSERLSSLEIHNEFELRRLLDRQVAWLCPLECLIDVAGRPTKQIAGIPPIKDETAFVNVLSLSEYRW